MASKTPTSPPTLSDPASSATSIWTRKLDLVYATFFAIHIVVMLCTLSTFHFLSTHVNFKTIVFIHLLHDPSLFDISIQKLFHYRVQASQDNGEMVVASYLLHV
jgi:hypothetical protein